MCSVFTRNEQFLFDRSVINMTRAHDCTEKQGEKKKRVFEKKKKMTYKKPRADKNL